MTHFDIVAWSRPSFSARYLLGRFFSARITFIRLKFLSLIIELLILSAKIQNNNKNVSPNHKYFMKNGNNLAKIENSQIQTDCKSILMTLLTNTPFSKKSEPNHIPQPVFFFVPSRLISSLVEPPPPELIPPLPPAARSKFAIKSLVTVIASQSCRVRDAVRPALNSDIPVHDTFSNR